MSKNYKIVVGVPQSQADAVREAMAQSGAGLSAKYSHASFSSQGIGRFKPLASANPAIGQIGQLEEVIEEQIETFCTEDKLSTVVEAIKKTHPYEEPVIDVYPLENI